ncbi:PREDICTED: autophagy-related protein 9A [Cyphomyrmex costatus]|uniref:autophagy-related protein 9A n=1 Tax=Cyphomyrmex costatus TaxID=456900 RepID=UPI00085245B3|nr:PREDICTED: autophagy-related protein 9A [Cyphomyrmex costatus]XP_018397547.1 PREDICTED: autophagy-related protein 9A [Cyphomyrmex costatus]XP_018397548.1 PREDICTED: autophagy-related protein 9A [Cyphomyrmex costatus]XP_018397550.1 PREDICTED: autophagy-related protein 9A [Cyphomyrmex costatus]
MKRETVITIVEPDRRAQTMTTVLDSSYQRIQPYEGQEEDADDEDDREEAPQESGVIIHVVPEGNKARWNHIEDLDSFFTRMYHYHQQHGFVCMMLQEILELLQFFFVVIFVTFLFHCIDYSKLYSGGGDANDTSHKSDAIMCMGDCIKSISSFYWSLLVVATIFFILQFLKVLYHLMQFWEIKMFFNTALKIADSELDNFTWHEVQKRVIEVQKEQEMCIHKRELTELDIYHRILRHKNYMVAMINKSLLPVRLKVPIIGEVIFLTRGLKYNMELLLFWGPWSPFENNWHLKEDYKKLNKRQELARSLSKHILWVGIANFVLCFLILLWQVLYTFFNYAETIKREPSVLAMRTWSLYGRLYLRHFNELDHEMNARLSRAYRPASKYMSSFTSPIMTIVAKQIAFITGSVLAVLLVITLIYEPIFSMERVVAYMTMLGAVAAAAKAIVPDENLVWCPETLLTAVLAHTHYRPDSWRGTAHTHTTRAQVAQLFQYRAVHLLEELVSPFVTTYILCFRMRHRALEIVDFFRNFTIEVAGVGDVCSFAQMDVRRHGNPMWQTVAHSPTVSPLPEERLHRSAGYDNQYGIDPDKYHIPMSNHYTQAEDGKTELSLIHFTLTNPEWKPPSHAENFVTALRERAKKEVTADPDPYNNPLIASLNSLSGLGYRDQVSNIIRSTMNQVSVPSMSNIFTNQPGTSTTSVGVDQSFATKSTILRRGVSKTEGPLHNDRGFLYDLQQGISNQSLGASVFGSGHSYVMETHTDPYIPTELTAADMSLSTLYLHELHHRQVRRRGYQEMATRSIWQRSPVQELATLPEVRQERIPLLLHQDSSLRKNRES